MPPEDREVIDLTAHETIPAANRRPPTKRHVVDERPEPRPAPSGHGKTPSPLWPRAPLPPRVNAAACDSRDAPAKPPQGTNACRTERAANNAVATQPNRVSSSADTAGPTSGQIPKPPGPSEKARGSCGQYRRDSAKPTNASHSKRPGSSTLGPPPRPQGAPIGLFKPYLAPSDGGSSVLGTKRARQDGDSSVSSPKRARLASGGSGSAARSELISRPRAMHGLEAAPSPVPSAPTSEKQKNAVVDPLSSDKYGDHADPKRPATSSRSNLPKERRPEQAACKGCHATSGASRPAHASVARFAQSKLPTSPAKSREGFLKPAGSPRHPLAAPSKDSPSLGKNHSKSDKQPEHGSADERVPRGSEIPESPPLSPAMGNVSPVRYPDDGPSQPPWAADALGGSCQSPRPEESSFAKNSAVVEQETPPRYENNESADSFLKRVGLRASSSATTREADEDTTYGCLNSSTFRQAAEPGQSSATVSTQGTNIPAGSFGSTSSGHLAATPDPRPRNSSGRHPPGHPASQRTPKPHALDAPIVEVPEHETWTAARPHSSTPISQRGLSKEMLRSQDPSHRDTNGREISGTAPPSDNITHNAEPPAETTSSHQDSGVFVPSMSSLLKSAMPAFSGMDSAKRVELVVGRSLEEMRKDNVHWTRLELRRARCSAATQARSAKTVKPTSIFKSLRPIRLDVVTEKPRAQTNTAEICVERYPSTSSRHPKTFYALECDMFETKSSDVPPYSHYVGIKNNFLAHNEREIHHWPYFGDDFNIDEQARNLRDHFSCDVDSRERKLLRMAQAEAFSAYAQDMLEMIGCDWSDILRFLLEPEPKVGPSADVRKALQNRDKYCEEDFSREARCWVALRSKLPASTPENMDRAALLCDQFQRITSLPLWHVVRRSDFTRNLLRSDPGDVTDDDLTCRVCMRIDCLYHGEMEEILDSDDNNEEVDAVVETDIINPRPRNLRKRVGLPAPSQDCTGPAPTKSSDRRCLDYWNKAQWSSLKFQPTERKPFYPCHHPGVSCETASCTCFKEKIMCEKSCSCPSSCARKFQGCLCAMKKSQKGHKLVCFDDDRCACFGCCRECDPDLCGNCGVGDVLDPLHKHEELPGRCRNASIQRGVAKHVLVGDSGIHGLGLYTCEDIQAHDFVGEYKGEVINKAEAERRGAVYEHQKLSYLFTLNNSQEVDSTYFGNKMRFINHAHKSKCNLYPRIIMVNTVARIALYGSRRVRPGEELFFDYGPMFPDEQLGGKRERKPAPRVRNSSLVHEFWDMEEVEDHYGNVRARKMASSDGSDDGRSSHDGMEAAPRPGRRCNPVAKKSIAAKTRPRAHPPGSRRPAKSRRVDEVDGRGEAVEGEGPDPPAARGARDEWADAGRRLRAFNILDGDMADAAEDEDFEPDDSPDEVSDGDASP